MKKLLSAALLALLAMAWAAPAPAQIPQAYQAQVSGRVTNVPVTAANPLPTTCISGCAGAGATPAGTNIIGKVGIDQTTPGTTDSVSLKSGAKIGGISFFVATTPTIQNAAYASGNCMGGFQAVLVSGTTGATGTLHAISVASKGGATTALQVYAFTSNPSASTCTDKSTFTINAADVSKLITSFAITPAAIPGTTVTYADNTSLGRTFATSGNGNIYLAIVAGGAFTPASTTDLVITSGGYADAP